jgi:hypothetical protein
MLTRKFDKLTLFMDDPALEEKNTFTEYLLQETFTHIYRPLRACSDAWTLAQLQHRLERLDTVRSYNHSFDGCSYKIRLCIG